MKKINVIFIFLTAFLSANALYSAALDTIPEIVWEKKVYGISNIFVGPNDQYVMTVGGDANYLIFYNPETGEPTDTLNFDTGVNYFNMTNDGSLFAANENGKSKESIIIYDGNTKKFSKRLSDRSLCSQEFKHIRRYSTQYANCMG